MCLFRSGFKLWAFPKCKSKMNRQTKAQQIRNLYELRNAFAISFTFVALGIGHARNDLKHMFISAVAEAFAKPALEPNYISLRGLRREVFHRGKEPRATSCES